MSPTAEISSSGSSHLVEQLLEILRERPGITVRELADELAGMDDIESIRSLSNAFQLVLIERARDIPADEPNQWLAPGWGPAPSIAEVEAAKSQGAQARAVALTAVLADSLTRDEAAAALGVSPQAISDRVKAGRLVRLRRGREWRFPAWQFGDDGTLPGIDRLVAAWPGSMLSLTVWAERPSPDLGGRTPAAELLGRDGVERVLVVVDAIAAAAW